MPVGPSYRDFSSPNRAADSWSYDVPVTWVARVCGVSDSSAPRLTTSRTSSARTTSSSSSQNAAPSHVGLDASHEDEVEFCARRSAERHPGRRPGDSPAHAIDQGHRRPVDLEVVVLVRFEFGQRARAPEKLQMLDCVRRGISGVIPSLERGHEDRVAQFWPPGGPVGHAPSLRPTSGVAPSRNVR